jgi:hypothetical protein
MAKSQKNGKMAKNWQNGKKLAKWQKISKMAKMAQIDKKIEKLKIMVKNWAKNWRFLPQICTTAILFQRSNPRRVHTYVCIEKHSKDVGTYAE